ncbi:hypothetical protein Tsubulata_050790 [Turnera subulata]|uniref:WIYLD domain-containing protein n=1 Tax=Turnera subulata TaxID=218843 RepID=A0A9Q0F8L1_9ROSI|nr:hypothetical protein Tsubulata_050790 [Turnera subulata]
MPPNPKIVRAYKAMRAIGITEVRVKPVLKRLVKVYDKNWEFIEDEEYRALVDAIFEEEAAQGSRAVPGAGEMANYENEVEDEHERPLKRLRRGLPGQSSSSFHNPNSGLIGLPSIKPEQEENFGTYCPLQSPDTRRSGCLVGLPDNYATQSHAVDRSLPPYSLSPQQRYAYKGKQPLVPQVAPRETEPLPFFALVPKVEPLTDDTPQHHLHHSLLPLGKPLLLF